MTPRQRGDSLVGSLACLFGVAVRGLLIGVNY